MVVIYYSVHRDTAAKWATVAQGWMQVPLTRLVDGAGSPPADAWTRIASLFEAGAENASDETPEHQDAA